MQHSIIMKKTDLISPFFLLFFAWTLNFLLYSLKFTTNITELNYEVICFFISIAFMIFGFHYFLRLRSSKNKGYKNISRYSIHILNRKTNKIFLFWILVSIFEIVMSGGLPLIWSLTKSGKVYNEFGIPSLHGFMNSIYFLLISSYTFLYLTKKKKTLLIVIFMLLIWPVLTLGRGILITVLMQMAIINLYVVKVDFKNLSKKIITIFFVIFIFGVIGDSRGYKNPFRYIVVQKYQPMFESLPSGFLWTYIYITSPLSNYSYNTQHLEPEWSLKYSLANLVPSRIRSKLFPTEEGSSSSHNFTFVNGSLNVSTIFASSHSDFGFYGDFSLIFLLGSWAYWWFRLLRLSSFYIIPYSLVSAVLVLSVFYNLFLLQPYLVSTMLQGLLIKSIKLKKTSAYQLGVNVPN